MASYDITALSTALEFDTAQGSFNSIIRWTDTRVINAWTGSSDSKGLIQGFDVNSGTGAVTAIGTPLSFDGTNNDANAKQVITFDSTHCLLVWRDGTDTQAKSRMLAVDGSGNVTTAGATKTLTSITQGPAVCLIDATHALVVGSGSGQDGFAQVITINTGTWAITEPAAALEFDTTDCVYPKVLPIDGTHFIVTWFQGGTGVMAQVLTVNTGTWEVTTEGTALNVGAGGGLQEICEMDNNHFMITFADNGSDGNAQVIEVNLGTWAVTNVGTPLEFLTGTINSLAVITFDATHAVVTYDSNGNAYMVTLAVDGSWNVSVPASALEYTTGNLGANYFSLCLLDSPRLVCAWEGDGSDGFTQSFDVTEQVGPANLKSYNTNLKANIKTINTNPIANVKSLNTNT